MNDVPRIISVDDHVFEPPDLWQSRLPRRYQERGPRVVRQRLVRKARGTGGGLDQWLESNDGDWCDVWHYEDVTFPLMRVLAAVGSTANYFDVVTFEDIRPGAWQQKDRLADMDMNNVEAALCFPNTLPRFCGQAFYEATDRKLARLCVEAYNDWLFDEWSGGDGKGRLMGAAILPLWDPILAAAEVRRCAGKGCVAVTFPENPHPLGLPSLHDKRHFWDPVFEACQETETVLCMHIGSSSQMPTTSPDAPFVVSGILCFENAMGSLIDFIFSRTLDRYPRLTIAYSEAQVGWMPFVLERADKVWRRAHAGLPNPPSSYVPGRVYGCIVDDEIGLKTRDAVGVDQICFETDYPHADSTFPDSSNILAGLAERSGLSEQELHKVARGNAINAFRLARIGIT